MTQQTTLTQEEKEYFKKEGYKQENTRLEDEILLISKHNIIRSYDFEQVGFRIVAINMSIQGVYIKRLK